MLCGMLNGKRKVDVQDAIYNCDGIDVLLKMVKVMDWHYKPDTPPQRLHGPTYVSVRVCRGRGRGGGGGGGGGDVNVCEGGVSWWVVLLLRSHEDLS